MNDFLKNVPELKIEQILIKTETISLERVVDVYKFKHEFDGEFKNDENENDLEISDYFLYFKLQIENFNSVKSIKEKFKNGVKFNFFKRCYTHETQKNIKRAIEEYEKAEEKKLYHFSRERNGCNNFETYACELDFLYALKYQMLLMKEINVFGEEMFVIKKMSTIDPENFIIRKEMTEKCA